MSSTTDFLGLFKYDPATDAASTFNITQALNNNWDKLDATIAAIDTAKADTKNMIADEDSVSIIDSADGAKTKRVLWSTIKNTLSQLFVPAARRINGKALSADITLTGDDIKTDAIGGTSVSAQLATLAQANENIAQVNKDIAHINDALAQVRSIANSANANVNTKAMAQIVSYTGTDAYGESAPCSVTFHFPFKVFWIVGHSAYNTFWTGNLNGNCVTTTVADVLTTSWQLNAGPRNGTSNNQANTYAKKSADGRTITWYSPKNQYDQFNQANYTYFCLAIG